MKNYLIEDLKENHDGDLSVSNGDIAITDKRNNENIIQYIRTILSTPFDYANDPTIGFDPSVFSGLQNTQRNAATIAQSIKFALTRDGYITPDTISVDAVPISDEDVIFVITVTSLNDDNEFQTLKVSVAFDTLNGKILTLRG